MGSGLRNPAVLYLQNLLRIPDGSQAVNNAITTCFFHCAPFHWTVGTFQCTKFEIAMVVAFYSRRRLAIFAQPEQKQVCCR